MRRRRKGLLSGLHRERGNVGDVLMMGMMVLAMAVVMMTFLDLIQLVQKKADVRQLSRQYLLEMETVGFLPAASAEGLKKELARLGAEEISLDGTTLRQASFGEVITLKISGKLGGSYEFCEVRTSTAKY
jgi:hypothetical protein